MNRELVRWIVLGMVLGIALGSMVGKSDWGAPVVMIGLGGLLGGVGGMVVRGIERTLRLKGGVTDHAGLGGALAGAVMGGVVGSQSGLGRLMIALFNPQLPAQDFAVPFGTVGGIVIGAFVGAVSTSGIYWICCRKVSPHDAQRDEAAASDD